MPLPFLYIECFGEHRDIYEQLDQILDERIHRERFSQVIMKAEGDSTLPITYHCVRRQRDHGDTIDSWIVLQFPDKPPAIHDWHGKITDHELGLVGAYGF